MSEANQQRTLADLLSLRGQVAVITGAAHGIGRATAWRLGEAGASLSLGDLDASAAEQLAREIADAYGIEAQAGRVDVADPASVRDFARGVTNRWGRLDAWVNCAGIWGTATIDQTDDALWRRTMAVDLDGSFHCAREAVAQMARDNGGGVLVLVTSLSAHKGRAGRSAYVAAKHGVNGLVRSLAVELGRAGIRVLAVAPSVTDTGAQDASSDIVALDQDLHAAMMQRAIDSMPLGRISTADEVARVALFAVSELASFMSGSTLFVDGGASAT